MSFRATHRNARIAPRKARLVADMIRGMNAAEALVALEFNPQRAAWYYKVFSKARWQTQKNRMQIHPASKCLKFRVDEGPTMKHPPKDRGRPHPLKSAVTCISCLPSRSLFRLRRPDPWDRRPILRIPRWHHRDPQISLVRPKAASLPSSWLRTTRFGSSSIAD